MTINAFFKKIFVGKKSRIVYCLIGKSGTGKSFRAKLIAEKKNIPLIIDDGLLIHENKIICGESAKKENNIMDAVRRAIFENEEHRNSVIENLKKFPNEKILLLGTSLKMIQKIIKTLDLPTVSKENIIQIEDVATKEEIAFAIEQRQKGHHVIPVPEIELEKSYSHIIYNKISFIVKSMFPTKIEKTIVKPKFEDIGKVYIDKEGIYQMVHHCVIEYNKLIKIKKIKILDKDNKYSIDIIILIPATKEINSSFFNLQKFISSRLLSYAEIDIEKINIKIAGLYSDLIDADETAQAQDEIIKPNQKN